MAFEIITEFYLPFQYPILPFSNAKLILGCGINLPILINSIFSSSKYKHCAMNLRNFLFISALMAGNFCRLAKNKLKFIHFSRCMQSNLLFIVAQISDDIFTYTCITINIKQWYTKMTIQYGPFFTVKFFWIRNYVFFFIYRMIVQRDLDGWLGIKSFWFFCIGLKMFN